MEDLDTPRVVAGADIAMLRTLERLGLVPDEPVLYQSTRTRAYSRAFGQLRDAGLVYPCRCSRAETGSGPYPGTCRERPFMPGAEPVAWRLRLPACTLEIADRAQGFLSWDLAALGDPILLRRDGLFSYQLAVVVDDAFQRVTDVVRGADLLDSTPWQSWLATSLGLQPPRYLHLPVLVEPDGRKLAKSRRSLPLDTLDPANALRAALAILCTGGSPPAGAGVAELLDWGVAHWETSRIASGREIRL